MSVVYISTFIYIGLISIAHLLIFKMSDVLWIDWLIRKRKFHFISFECWFWAPILSADFERQFQMPPLLYQLFDIALYAPLQDAKKKWIRKKKKKGSKKEGEKEEAGEQKDVEETAKKQGKEAAQRCIALKRKSSASYSKSLKRLSNCIELLLLLLLLLLLVL